jgi:hypothetical protein
VCGEGGGAINSELTSHGAHIFSENYKTALVEVLLYLLKDQIALAVEILPGAVADNSKVATQQFFIHAELSPCPSLDLLLTPASSQQPLFLSLWSTP